MVSIDLTRTLHCVVAGEGAAVTGIEDALLYHLPLYLTDTTRRTRISLLFSSTGEMDDFIFEYKELLDHSFYRIVRLDTDRVESSLHKPLYHESRKDFVDVEWEFIIGQLSHPAVQEKLSRWSADPKQTLLIQLCYSDREKNERYARKLRGRLPDTVEVEIINPQKDEEQPGKKELLAMAKCLNYCYKMSFEQGVVPTELPWEEVEKAWEAVTDEKIRKSNIYNVRTIPFKMQLVGHGRDDWEKFYALSGEEIEMLTAVEHNRWSTERLIQGSRPCTDEERREVEEDFRRRAADNAYALANPVTLKKRYARERGAHFDLCAYSELGVDETGLPVTRYDRDLTMAIPLIVKTAAEHG